MSDFIAIEVQGLEELQNKLDKLPGEAQDEGIDEANKYLINVYRGYPHQVYVSRKSAYGVSFFSDKQRRFFFAALRDGRISVPYKRTQALSRGWKQFGHGRNSFLANEVPHAGLMMGPGEQSRMAIKGGWKDIVKIAKERIDKVTQKFDVGVKRAIRRLGL